MCALIIYQIIIITHTRYHDNEHTINTLYQRSYSSFRIGSTHPQFIFERKIMP